MTGYSQAQALNLIFWPSNIHKQYLAESRKKGGTRYQHDVVLCCTKPDSKDPCFVSLQLNGQCNVKTLKDCVGAQDLHNLQIAYLVELG